MKSYKCQKQNEIISPNSKTNNNQVGEEFINIKNLPIMFTNILSSFFIFTTYNAVPFFKNRLIK